RQGYVSQVCWTNVRHRSFAALRMTQPRAVILSAAKDLSPTYGASPAKPDRKTVPKRTAQPSLLVMITCGGHGDTITNTFSVIERRTVMTQPSTRILVLGAGIAGLLFTLRLAGKVANESVQITLVDESDTFTVRPRLH